MEEGTGGGAFRLDHVVGIVAEGLARFQFGELAHNPVAFHHKGIAVRVPDDPFAAKDVHGLLGGVADGDVIDERMWPVWRRGTRRVILHLIHCHGQASKMLEADIHDDAE